MTGDTASARDAVFVRVWQASHSPGAACPMPRGWGRALSNLTAVGFEPTPLGTGAGSQRLRPLGQTVLLNSECINCRSAVLFYPSTGITRPHLEELRQTIED